MIDLVELKNITVTDVTERSQESKLCFKVTQYPGNTYIYKAESEQRKVEIIFIDIYSFTKQSFIKQSFKSVCLSG